MSSSYYSSAYLVSPACLDAPIVPACRGAHRPGPVGALPLPWCSWSPSFLLSAVRPTVCLLALACSWSTSPTLPRGHRRSVDTSVYMEGARAPARRRGRQQHDTRVTHPSCESGAG